MPKKLLFIGPVRNDSRSGEKRKVVSEECALQDWAAEFPDYDPQIADFSLDDMLDAFRAAALILADLSFERPSCYFELGCAETLRRPVALVAERGTAIHQTAHRSEVAFFGDIDEFRHAVRSFISRKTS
jgi:hypothetical protein